MKCGGAVDEDIGRASESLRWEWERCVVNKPYRRGDLGQSARNHFWLELEQKSEEETGIRLTRAAKPMAEVKELGSRRERGKAARGVGIQENGPDDPRLRSFTKKIATRAECLPALGRHLR